jgi:hypothetical protein
VFARRPDNCERAVWFWLCLHHGGGGAVAEQRRGDHVGLDGAITP